jgi:hypothetical protein
MCSYGTLDQWYWYVDDSEMKCKEDQSEEILEHLNSIKPDVIVFTKENQVEDTLPILDLEQKVDRTGKRNKSSVWFIIRRHTPTSMLKRNGIILLL